MADIHAQRVRAGVAIAITGGILMTGCARNDSSSATPPTSGTTTVAATTSQATTTAPATSAAATRASGSAYAPDPEPELVPVDGATARTEILTGVVGSGTESGCRLLATGDGRAVQLLGGDDRLSPGATVTVEGRRLDGAATTCQEGTPFQVTRVVAPER